MKKLLLIAVLIGCQSQADKDRAEMQGLIEQKIRIEKELFTQKDQRDKDREVLWKSFEGDVNYESKMDSSVAVLTARYPRIPSLMDSLQKAETRISELKLLMGK